MDSSNRITQKKNPRDTANFFSICFFWWVTFRIVVCEADLYILMLSVRMCFSNTCLKKAKAFKLKLESWNDNLRTHDHNDPTPPHVFGMPLEDGDSFSRNLVLLDMIFSTSS